MPLAVIPIRTEAAVRGSPLVNYWLIAVNIAAFLAFGDYAPATLREFAREQLYFRSYPTHFHHFFTYQFLHGDVSHLLGNMLFLWVFGNSVCGKMGGGPYLLFYLACGVFAAWANAMFKAEPFFLIGASGSIAGITTAYLALFPRSYVTVMVWLFFFIQFFELPAMILIGLKVIVWDNLISPRLGSGGEQVAYLAHLGGYLFGFAGSLAMLGVRGIARDQFDILALWGRWHRRKSWQGPAPRRLERPAVVDAEQRKAETVFFDQITDLRQRIIEDITQRATGTALDEYERLQTLSPGQVLPEPIQLEVAREYYRRGQFDAAVKAFARFLQCYPESGEAPNIRLLTGIIHARDLKQYETAEKLLSDSMRVLRDEDRRQQCQLWLHNVRTALGRPESDFAHP